MIVALAAGVVLSLSGVAYVGYKYHSAKAALAAVKAEVAKIESEALQSAVVVDALAAVRRLKALL